MMSMFNLDLIEPLDRGIFCIRTRPAFRDACEHGADTFAFSFEFAENDGSGGVRRIRYDAYLHRNSGRGVEVCLRYGDEADAYASAGPLARVMREPKAEYKVFVDLLTQVADIEVIARKPKEKKQDDQ